MTPHHLTPNGGPHLRGRLRFALRPQTAGNLIEVGLREPARGTKQNSVPGFLPVNSMPGVQDREVRMFLGRMIWPLVESLVVSIGKTPVRLWHKHDKSPFPQIRNPFRPATSELCKPGHMNIRTQYGPDERFTCPQ